ncbi:MAG TPA: NADH-quinone oxidoreductase subunit NuoH [Anaerolineae bacterium]|nr:NADH-quinone oxidoreductase subunit NuoH [Anaerolineae bacterium]HPL27949.1 NADH-quinone oxidoreductase subunit NuoH [Anaerolineae bacterium]
MPFLNNLFGNLQDLISSWLAGFLPQWGVDLAMMAITTVALLAFLVVVVMYLTYLERKVLGRIADRPGPNRVGPLGLFQPFADVLKLIIKEATTPQGVDYPTYILAPILIVAPALLVYAVIPFGPRMVPTDINVALLFVVAISSVATLALLMGGWGSGNKYSLLGGMRAVAQMISYELPLAFAFLGVVLVTGSLSLVKIVEGQPGYPLALAQPIGFLIALICVVAESNRAPFDLPEAESELVAGYHTEYGGVRFAMFFLAEYIEMFTGSAMVALLFLGGWRGPILPPYVWMLIKVYAVLFFMFWLRGTFPRLRVDQLMGLSWKFLLPLGMVNVIVMAFIDKLHLPGGFLPGLAASIVILAVAGGVVRIGRRSPAVRTARPGLRVKEA